MTSSNLLKVNYDWQKFYIKISENSSEQQFREFRLKISYRYQEIAKE